MTEQPTERAAPLSDERLAEIRANMQEWEYGSELLPAGEDARDLLAALDAMTARCRESAAALERRQAEIEDLTDRVEALGVAGEELVRLLQQSLWYVPDGSGIRTGFRYTELAWRTALAAATPGAGPLVGEG